MLCVMKRSVEAVDDDSIVYIGNVSISTRW
jgi:hypothetical protein